MSTKNHFVTSLKADVMSFNTHVFCYPPFMEPPSRNKDTKDFIPRNCTFVALSDELENLTRSDDKLHALELHVSGH